MKSSHKNYLTNLLGIIDDENQALENFLEEDIQGNYDQFRLKNQLTKSHSFTFFICFPMFFLSLSTLIKERKFIRLTYFCLIGVFFDIFLSLFLKKYENSYSRVKWFRYFRFFSFYFNVALNWIFPEAIVDGNVIRYSYIAIIYVNFILNYLLEFNYLILIAMTLFNSTVFLIVQFNRNLAPFYLIPDIIFNILYYYLFSLLKKSELKCEKLSFIESYKNKNYIEYIQNLVDVINTMIISVQNNDILFVNDYALNYFTKSSHLKNPTFHRMTSIPSYENDILINYSNENNQFKSDLNQMIHNFLNYLIIDSSINYKVGENLKEIIQNISNENETDSVNFIKLGYFSNFKIKNSHFEIHARKLKYQKEAVELLIYDISEIKNAEKQAIESKYKHKILAKIAHEFKTPLITIISLSERIVNDQVYLILDENTKKNLYYINNLSNYSLSLISDIINYVSNCINLRINKNEVSLHEVMDFSNNVLKTLVECNEHKSQKIKTELVIDKELENMRLFTDENRIKQILLNFISNAFKFTHEGYIKLKAKFIEESKQVEISVKDTGIGIKDEDHDLIFKENVELNVDGEYNHQGSGLGLSIVKNMADYLNLKIGFKSLYGKGSKFYLIINCNTEYSVCKLRTVSFKKSCSSLNKITNMEFSRIRLFDDNNRKIKIFEGNKKPWHKKILIERNIKSVDIGRTEEINYKSEDPQDYKKEDIYYGNVEITNLNFMIGNTKVLNTNSIKLVIVDDHKFVREHTINLLKLLLKDFSNSLYEIVECCDGIELLNIIRLDTANLIKLILVDENMEYLNGSESVKIIRNLEFNKKIKQYHIVSITAFDDEQTKERILKSGVNSILNKPCNKSNLSIILKSFFFPYI